MKNLSHDIFAKNAWYFRNAMVRANYTNVKKDVHETTEDLELFLRNLLLDEKNPLQNRTMHISGVLKGKANNDPINGQNDPINDPIKLSVLAKRERDTKDTSHPIFSAPGGSE